MTFREANNSCLSMTSVESFLHLKSICQKCGSPVACDVKTQSPTNTAATVTSGLKIQLGKKSRVTYSPDCL